MERTQSHMQNSISVTAAECPLRILTGVELVVQRQHTACQAHGGLEGLSGIAHVVDELMHGRRQQRPSFSYAGQRQIGSQKTSRLPTASQAFLVQETKRGSEQARGIVNRDARGRFPDSVNTSAGLQQRAGKPVQHVLSTETAFHEVNALLRGIRIVETLINQALLFNRTHGMDGESNRQIAGCHLRRVALHPSETVFQAKLASIGAIGCNERQQLVSQLFEHTLETGSPLHVVTLNVRRGFGLREQRNQFTNGHHTQLEGLAGVNSKGGQSSQRFELKDQAYVGNWVAAEATLLARLSQLAEPQPGRRELFEVSVDDALAILKEVSAQFPPGPESTGTPSASTLGMSDANQDSIDCPDSNLLSLLDRKVTFDSCQQPIKALLLQASPANKRCLKALEKLGFRLVSIWQGTRWFQFVKASDRLTQKFPKVAPALPLKAELVIRPKQ